jgi:hypothetical protein
VHTNTEEIIEVIINHCIKTITTDDENISKEYLKSFDTMYKFYSSFQKIFLRREILENVSLMGSFGKAVQSRRYSVYFCSCFIQMVTNPIHDLVSRLLILSQDADQLIRQEFIHHAKFFALELEESQIRKSIYKIVKLFS